MIWTLLHIIDIIAWMVLAWSTSYVAFFVIIHLLHPSSSSNSSTGPSSSPEVTKGPRFLVLIPAYHEDSVILHTVDHFLEQTYPQEDYQLTVISDHIGEETNEALRTRPIHLLIPKFEKSSKAKALQFAMEQVNKRAFDYVVILDADNLVDRHFLASLASLTGKEEPHSRCAIQCHRCAKNSNNSIAALDGISEEINNTIFRKAHNDLGLSSALIGSGMCFDCRWFADNVKQLSTAGEDRELEQLLLQQRIFIRYASNIHVFDEKVSSKENFQQQRRRWMSAQLHSLLTLLPLLPHAIRTGNINLIDKTLQQALVPRSLLLAGILFFALLTLVAVPVWTAKWWILAAVITLSLFFAIPRRLRNATIWRQLTALPHLIWEMLRNLNKLDKDNKEFSHTQHGTEGRR